MDTDNPIFKKIMEEKQPLPNIDGYMWLNVLIRFNARTGEAFVERSFAKPAEMSKIKHLVKKKSEAKKINIEKVEGAESLF